MGRTLLETYSDSADEEVMLRESNLVIILAAMLCSLICLVGLFSMVRCAMRCRGRRLVIQSTHRLFFPVVDRGLSKTALQALPVVEFTVTDCLGAIDCAICLAEFDQSDKVRRLPNCHHCFHVSCIDTWFSSHSSCPTCRRGCSVHADEKCPNLSLPCPSDATSAPGEPNSLHPIPCPAHYWNGEHTADRYLP
ncbi:hypothetical protein SUGI_0796650 [Cryptomeria japonica]|uniref:RING-H2 finger protein ATL74 n=1 Tax=Cryptomeria japonica TaxID=3369 RepID=UPI002414B062|nr:RING-H2 finger protein ATL74 [Cryptomeria japonica]GLJ39079.1 hypothetical protein SUGI_0796650 [Cryptomeria japonica]